MAIGKFNIIFINIILLLHYISEYFLRRVRDEFHQNRNIQDSSKIAELLKRGQKNLEILRRQVS